MPNETTPGGDGLTLAEIEAIARVGSYSLDIAAGRWTSSVGLDAIFGIDRAFDRSVDGWVSLIHPEDRDAMLAYLTEEVLGRRHPFDREYRIVRTADGEVRWVHGRGRLDLDADGRPVRMLGTIVDVTDRWQAQEALQRSEARYATVFEGALEAILIAERTTLRLRYANQAAAELLGYAREELLGLTIRDIHPAEDLPTALAAFEAAARTGRTVARAIPCLRADGAVVLADIRATAAEIDGGPCIVGFFTDVTALRRLEARDWLLARAIEQTGDAVAITGPSGRIEYANPAFARLIGHDPGGLAHASETIASSLAPDGEPASAWERVQAGGDWGGDLVHRRPDGSEVTAEASISLVRGPDGSVAGVVAVERDVTAERALEAAHARLAAAVAQASDSVIVTDAQGTIEYVNPAFERTSGYRADEAVGRNPRILKSGHQPDALYRAMWRRLAQGRTWSGTLVNRRKDGTLYEEEATISPILDAAGVVTGFVGVKRDVTAIHAAESALARQARERAEVAAALARLGGGGPVDQTAADVCAELLAVTGIDIAAIFDFVGPGRAVTLAAGGPPGLPLQPGRPLPSTRATYLHERAGQGPWAEAWRARPEDGPYGAAIHDLGIRAVAYAPIRHGDDLVGLVAAGTRDPDYAAHLVDHLPIVGEFAAAAGGLLGGRLNDAHRQDLGRAGVERVIAEGRFVTAVQPIVELATHRRAGEEALTRFLDGTPPDRMFAGADLVGLGPELELACARVAIESAAGEGRPGWLSLNVSPATLLRTAELHDVLAPARRPIVLEITEHIGIDDYGAVRRAVDRLGPGVRLAVDDAGSGFASLRHVVELRPAHIKLDRWLISDVDRDPTRQAMIAGLAEFARRIGSDVIAEGIETTAELAVVTELGVALGQGFVLGRPAPPTDDGAWPTGSEPPHRRTVRSSGRAAVLADGARPARM